MAWTPPRSHARRRLGGGGLSWPSTVLGRGENAGDDSPGGQRGRGGAWGGGAGGCPEGRGGPDEELLGAGGLGEPRARKRESVIPMGWDAPGKSGAGAWVSGGCGPADGRASRKSMACWSLEGAALRPRSRPPPPGTPPPAFAWIRWPAGGPASRRQSKGPAAIQATTRGLRCPATGRPSWWAKGAGGGGGRRSRQARPRRSAPSAPPPTCPTSRGTARAGQGSGGRRPPLGARNANGRWRRGCCGAGGPCPPPESPRTGPGPPLQGTFSATTGPIHQRTSPDHGRPIVSRV